MGAGRGAAGVALTRREHAQVCAWASGVLAADCLTKWAALRFVPGAVIQNYGAGLSVIRDYGELWWVPALVHGVLLLPLIFAVLVITRSPMLAGAGLGASLGNLGEQVLTAEHGVTDWIPLQLGFVLVTVNLADVVIVFVVVVGTWREWKLWTRRGAEPHD